MPWLLLMAGAAILPLLQQGAASLDSASATEAGKTDAGTSLANRARLEANIALYQHDPAKAPGWTDAQWAAFGLFAAAAGIGIAGQVKRKRKGRR
jgi:hypothetical protein